MGRAGDDGGKGGAIMDRQEKIKVMATDVMGMSSTMKKCKCSSFVLQYEGGCQCGSWKDFNPYANSADCDALIEAFLTTVEGVLEFQIDHELGQVQAEMIKYKPAYCARCYFAEWKGTYTTAKKNEAVCEAILKAVM